jgi:hypothetical protein
MLPAMREGATSLAAKDWRRRRFGGVDRPGAAQRNWVRPVHRPPYWSHAGGEPGAAMPGSARGELGAAILGGTGGESEAALSGRRVGGEAWRLG